MAEGIFDKPLIEITAKDRYIYEQLPTLPAGVILIDLADDENTRCGKLPLSDTVITDLLRFTKEVVKKRQNGTESI